MKLAMWTNPYPNISSIDSREYVSFYIEDNAKSLTHNKLFI